MSASRAGEKNNGSARSKLRKRQRADKIKNPAEGERENEEKKKKEERGERKTKGPLGPRENAEDGT